MKFIRNIKKNKLHKKSLFFLKKRLDKIKKDAKIDKRMRRKEQTKINFKKIKKSVDLANYV